MWILVFDVQFFHLLNLMGELFWGYCLVRNRFYPYQEIILMSLAGTGAVLGHIYPFFLDFRGGKGVACYIGMLLAINWQIGLAVIIGLILITIITDEVTSAIKIIDMVKLF